MVRTFTTLLVGLTALAIPASAIAGGQPVAPPGNSGVSQYVEQVPTAGGGQPTKSVHVNPPTIAVNPSGAGGTTPPKTGGTTAKPSHRATGAISAATQSTLDSLGSSGADAVAVAVATAPSARRPSPALRHRRRIARLAPGQISPAADLLKTLTGSAGGGGGLGVFLPVILVSSVLITTAEALRRRRG
jgi:hypothetical protein